jgi:hypothetical protein
MRKCMHSHTRIYMEADANVCADHDDQADRGGPAQGGHRARVGRGQKVSPQKRTSYTIHTLIIYIAPEISYMLIYHINIVL